jgi:anaerobic ribonucleoside-triphosphate reductase activating protein
MKVQIAGIAKESVTDGPGLRTTIFFQGCGHVCRGCHNPQTWSFTGGTEYDLEDFVHQLPDTPLIKGVTLTGGDPFYQPQAALVIARLYKERGKDIWAYTGFTWDELISGANSERLELLKTCDVLVDGPFLLPELDLTLPFRGSSNQRLIDVKTSLQENKVVEYSSGLW